VDRVNSLIGITTIRFRGRDLGNVEDSLSDEEREEMEEAILKNKREKTKYGSQLERDN
jgi:sporulation protein YlmC with PRC-barrel domain